MTNHSHTNKQDLSQGFIVTFIGIIANVILVVIKLYAGFIGRSQALIADGFHSLSDLFSDFVVLFGFMWGRKDEDEDHPFGHGRIETISSMLIGVILILVGFGIVYNSVTKIYEHQQAAPSLFTILVAFLSIIIKEAMYWYTLKVGKKLKSSVLIANAWHHRTDAMSSIAVLVGVGGAYLNPSWVLADVLAALFVTYFIIKVGGSMVWAGLREVVDTAPDKKVVEQIISNASGVGGVMEVHDVRARYSGGQILVEMHIVVEPEMTVFDGHEIAASVKYAVLGNVEDVTRVIIHVDPKIKTAK